MRSAAAASPMPATRPLPPLLLPSRGLLGARGRRARRRAGQPRDRCPRSRERRVLQGARPVGRRQVARARRPRRRAARTRDDARPRAAACPSSRRARRRGQGISRAQRGSRARPAGSWHRGGPRAVPRRHRRRAARAGAPESARRRALCGTTRPMRGTASVLFEHRGSTPPLSADSIQRLIAGGVAGLIPGDVTVVMVPRPASPSMTEAGMGHVGPIAVARSSLRFLQAALAALVALLAALSAATLMLYSRLGKARAELAAPAPPHRAS